jgi:DNA-binding CsgD family transcriptional regulator
MAHLRSMRSLPKDLRLDAEQMNRLLGPGPSARGILRFLDSVAPIEYISVVEYGRNELRQISGYSLSHPVQDTTARCFAIYQAEFAHEDEATYIARAGCEDPLDPSTKVLHYDVTDIPVPLWRERVFDPARLTGRVSFVFSNAEDTAIAVNVYRNRRLGHFHQKELDRLADVAPLVKLAFQHAIGTRTGASSIHGPLESTIGIRVPSLSERERQVAIRISQGMTSDGIALDLGLAPSTVVTIRKRLYTKLDIHNRVQLIRALS